MAEGLTVRVETTTYIDETGETFEGGYISLCRGKPAETVELTPEVYLDIDSDGELAGIEFLSVPFSAKILLRVAKKYGVPALRKARRIPGLKAVLAREK